MENTKLFLLVIISSWCMGVAEQAEHQLQEDNVKDIILLNDVTFDEALNKNEVLFVSFYTPGCAACEQLELELVRATHMLSDQSSRVRVAKVDTTESPLLTKRFSITSHPMLRLLGDVRSVDTVYSGTKTAEAMVGWLLRRTGPQHRLFSVEEVKAFTAGRDVAVVAFLDAEDDGGEPALVVAEWADAQEDFPVAVTSANDVLKHYGAGAGSVVMFNKDEPGLETAIESVSQLQEWASISRTPLLLTLSEDTYGQVFSREDNTIVLLFSRAEGAEKPDDGDGEEVEGESENGSETADPRDAMREVAKEWRGKVKFVWVDAASSELQRVREWFGVFPDSVPTLRGLRSRRLQRFKPSRTGVSQESVSAFLRELTQQKLKPYLPSEAVAAGWDSGPVKALVGDIFDSVVMDRSRDVVVDLYAPWCGHCKRLEPVLEELGEKYKDSETVTIAKMDSTKNELTHTRPRSFPSIRMWKKGTNEVVEYNGERTVQGISRFIETNGDYGRGPIEDDEFGDEDMEYEEDLEDDSSEWSERHTEL